MQNFISLLLFVDEHCIQMLKDGVVEQLGQLLAKHSGRDGDIRMQHAVLSALRNLAIPGKRLFSVSFSLSFLKDVFHTSYLGLAGDFHFLIPLCLVPVNIFFIARFICLKKIVLIFKISREKNLISIPFGSLY